MSNGELTTRERTQAIAPRVPAHLAGLLDPERFNHLWRVATAFARSTLVPDNFRGSPDNCFIGIQLAMRLEVDPFMLFQGLSVIHGRPNMEGKLMIALLNSSGKIKGTIRYRFDGQGDKYGCTAIVTDAETGAEVEGPKVDWEMVKAEGWSDDKKTRDGKTIKSKWKTMARLMFHYRSAAYLVRTHYPEVLMGLQTREEAEDTVIQAEFQAAHPAAVAGVEYASRSEAVAAQLAGDDAFVPDDSQDGIDDLPPDDGSQEPEPADVRYTRAIEEAGSKKAAEAVLKAIQADPDLDDATRQSLIKAATDRMWK